MQRDAEIHRRTMQIEDHMVCVNRPYFAYFEISGPSERLCHPIQCRREIKSEFLAPGQSEAMPGKFVLKVRTMKSAIAPIEVPGKLIVGQGEVFIGHALR